MGSVVGSYLGCDIIKYAPDEVVPGPDPVYSSPCITGYYKTKRAVKKRICQGQGGTWDGSSCSFEPPQPIPYWVYVQTVETPRYGAVELFQKYDQYEQPMDLWRAQREADSTVLKTDATYEDVMAYIMATVPDGPVDGKPQIGDMMFLGFIVLLIVVVFSRG